MSAPRIRKAGTRAGQPHYSLECRACPALYGVDAVLRIGHVSRDTANELYSEHLATNHGRTQ